MKENLQYHLALGAFLNTADRHYLDGRILWFSNSPFGAGMPLWLAAEQMIKLYIVQDHVEKKSLGSVSVRDGSGAKVTLTYSPTEVDMNVALQVVGKSFYDLSPKHSPDPLLTEMTSLLDISAYKDALEKIHDLYERRYFVNTGFALPLDTVHKLDEVYFKVRNSLSKNIPRALMDEIAYQKKFDTGHPLSNFMYAYYKNPSFKAKEHPVVYQLLPDEKIIANNGTDDMNVDSVPNGIPVHVAVKELNY
jgi:hypothetical protein